MGRLDGAVAIVTGAGRGLGREHALLLAREGARVVVNDLGGDISGEGQSLSPAQEVVAEIEALGGQAVANGADVSDWQGAAELLRQAIDTFGDLNVLVNNAGILRDRTLANMTEAEWDAVIAVHLKGHAAPAKHAVAYWREKSKHEGRPVYGSVVHTSSVAGYAGNFGQANYSAAKLAVCAFSQVIALEAGKYGVRSNVVSPGARTRLGVDDAERPGRYGSEPADDSRFDAKSPANVSPLVVWLSAPDCPATGQMFHCDSNRVVITRMPPILHVLRTEGRWTLEALDEALPDKLVDHGSIWDWFD